VNSVYRGKKLKDIEAASEAMISNTDFAGCVSRTKNSSGKKVSVTNGLLKTDTFDNHMDETRYRVLE
jgi:hypothetical protein